MPPIAKTLPGFENTGWFGIVAPTGTPKDIIQKVYQDTKKALESTEMKARFYVQGLAPVGNTPEEMGRAMKEETAALGARGARAQDPGEVKVDLQQVEEAAKELYIRALKLLPPDIKQGFDRLAAGETDAGAKRMLGTMMKNITVAEDTRRTCFARTPASRSTTCASAAASRWTATACKEAIRRGCARSTREYSFRSSIVHPTTRVNEQTSTGRGVPIVHFEFSDEEKILEIEMIPKGSGSENNSWLKMAIPAEGVDAIKTFVVDCVLEAGGKTCPPTIVGVGVGGTADLCVHLAKVAATRALGSRCEDPEGAKLEEALTRAVNMLGVGPQGLGGDSTAFAVHVETAATHITMNPVAVNMQCHSARRARATFTPGGIEYGF